MKIRDKNLKKMVDVAEKNCPKFKCYWARPDPGVFTQGVGYRQTCKNPVYLCGHRDVHGCPENPQIKAN